MSEVIPIWSNQTNSGSAYTALTNLLPYEIISRVVSRVKIEKLIYNKKRFTQIRERAPNPSKLKKKKQDYND